MHKPAADLLRVALIAPCRFPVAEPFAGGLEAHVWLIANTLRQRGHEVTLFAAPGTDPTIADHRFAFPALHGDVEGRRDLSGDPRLTTDEHRAYLSVMTTLARQHRVDFDVIHNNSLHYLPVALAHLAGAPMVSTLHTPPIRMVELGIASAVRSPSQFVAVSQFTADSWASAIGPMCVVHNGVDTTRWQFGPGGGPLIWFGRIVAEKGLDLAIDAARLAGLPLDIAGPIIDQAFFDQQVAPRLGPSVRYLGHLSQRELAVCVGAASAALVTPRWDEPYGLVVAEALACGTPVAGFARGGIPEIVTPECGRLAASEDVELLADAISEAVMLSRQAARDRAVAHCSVDSMVDAYVEIYRTLAMRAAERADAPALTRL